MKKTLFWFRQDLRIADNAGLWQATQSDQCEAIVILSPEQWQLHDDADCKIHFYLRQLLSLQQSLADLNIPLMVKIIPLWQDVPDYLATWVQQRGIDAVYCNMEFGWNERQRDQQVAQRLQQQQIAFYIQQDRTLFPVASIRNKQGLPYQVFGAFKKACYQQLSLALPQCYPQPESQSQAIENDVDTNKAIIEAVLIQYAITSGIEQNWQVGEETAIQELNAFIHEHVATYDQQRDYPAQQGTSQLSAYLTCGILSVRQCIQALFVSSQGDFYWHYQGEQVWLDELLWREFYQHILFDYPKLSQHRAFKAETESIEWRESPEDLARWQRGETGIPIVDAGMRQLMQTGWMHNRVRMITAMFLSKNVLIDWRKGEQWFMQHLIDGDLAANNGGWQWCASTGTDAVPYFRIFNPITQSQRFDPQGEYLRTWLPELAMLDHRQIHEPYAKADIGLKLDYPKPMVDLKASRERAIRVFKQN